MDLRLALLLLFTVSMALARNHAKFSDLKEYKDFMNNDEVLNHFYWGIRLQYACNTCIIAPHTMSGLSSLVSVQKITRYPIVMYKAEHWLASFVCNILIIRHKQSKKWFSNPTIQHCKIWQGQYKLDTKVHIVVAKLRPGNTHWVRLVLRLWVCTVSCSHVDVLGLLTGAYRYCACLFSGWVSVRVVISYVSLIF